MGLVNRLPVSIRNVSGPGSGIVTVTKKPWIVVGEGLILGTEEGVFKLDGKYLFDSFIN